MSFLGTLEFQFDEGKNHTNDDHNQNDSSNGEDLSMMLLPKLLISFAVTLEVILFGLIPAFGGNYVRLSERTKELAVSLSNAFAGGVFLSGALVHLLAESMENFVYSFPEIEDGSGIVCLFSGLGYLLVFFLEKVLLAKHHEHAHSHSLEMTEVGKGKKHEDSHHHHSSTPTPHHSSHHGATSVSPSPPSKPTEGEATPATPNNITDSEYSLTTPDIESTGQQEGRTPGSLDATQFERTEGLLREEEEEVESDTRQEEKKRNVSAIALTSVLFLHTFISGLALSLQTSLGALLGLGLAIALHKWVEAFALGVSMHKLQLPIRRRVIMILIYSTATPAGMILGALLEIAVIHTERVMLITQAIGGAIASGTFLYVAAADILAEEFASTKDKWKKVVACLVGFGFMVLLKFLLHS